MLADVDLEKVYEVVSFETPDECEVPRNTHPCTVKAVGIHYAVCSGKSRIICQELLDRYIHAMGIGGTCSNCKNDIHECWSFVPLP